MSFSTHNPFCSCLSYLYFYIIIKESQMIRKIYESLSKLIKTNLFLLYFDFCLLISDRTASSYLISLELNKYVTKIVFKQFYTNITVEKNMSLLGFDFTSLKYLGASFLATYCSGLTHPLDVIKTRLQSHDGKARSDNLVPHYRSTRDAFRSIYRDQGIRGLYKGFYISLICQASAISFFFWIYEVRKRIYSQKGLQKMDAVALASIEASVIATVATQPVWVIKTRMLLNVNKNITEWQNFQNQSKQIYRQHGLKGFVKGLQLSLILSSTGVTQMYLYQGFKILYEKLKIPQTQFQEKHLICGGISKILSVFVSYPLTTIRTRIQQNQFVNNNQNMKYTSSWQITQNLLRNQGFSGLFKGMSANLMRGVGQKGIYFYCYQKIKDLIIDKQTSNN